MKKQWKRLAALSSAVIMAAGTLLYFPTDTLQNISWGITASAEETGEGTESGSQTWNEDDGLTWTLDADGTLTISGTGAMMDIPAFNNSNIKKVVIQEGVTSIGERAFEGCTVLTSITIPKSVTSIGYRAFFDTPWLTNKQKDTPLVIVNGILIDGTACSGEVTIPDGVTNIGIGAFCNCTGLTSINIPKSVTSIGEGTFDNCTGLTNITIPKSVESVGDRAFYGCDKLTVNLENGSKLTSENLGVDASKIVTYWNEGNLTWTLAADGTMTISGEGAMKAYSADGSPAAQKKDNVKKVVIQEGVTSIGMSAFNDCDSLTSITIPESVTSIGNYAFRDCSSLASIEIPSSVTSIGDSAFDSCSSLTSITIP